MVKGLLLTLTFMFGAFLRIYGFDRFSSLTSEVAQHYLEIIKLESGLTLLSGPLTSHEWLRLSATPYYLFYPIFSLLDFHPLSLGYLWTLTGILLVPLNYFIVKTILDSKTAFYSTLIITASPLYLNINRIPGFFNFVIPLTYILVFIIFRISKGSLRSIWAGSLVLGLMSTLHAASFMLVPFFLGVLLYLRKLTVSRFIGIMFIISAINIPYLANDFSMGFSMTAKLLLWIPYKFVNFLTGKVVGIEKTIVADTTFVDISDFIKSGFLPEYFHWIAGAVIFGFIASYFLTKKGGVFERILFAWMVFGILVLLIHKNPPIHYFIPLFPIPVILISKIISGMRFGIFIPATVMLINLVYFFLTPAGLDSAEKSGFIPYKNQLKIAEIIITKSEGRGFSLSRVGQFDNYVDEFRQNYEYLLWWLGNRPVSKSDLHFVIIESPDVSIQKTKGEIIGAVDRVRIVLISR